MTLNTPKPLMDMHQILGATSKTLIANNQHNTEMTELISKIIQEAALSRSRSASLHQDKGLQSHADIVGDER